MDPNLWFGCSFGNGLNICIKGGVEKVPLVLFY